MRPVSQGAPGRADARAARRARAHGEPRRRGAAARFAALIGAIVAGGGSTRFGGEPKGLRQVGGARIIDRVASALRAVTSELVVVANAPDAASWLPGARLVRDTRPERASAVGLHSALAAAAGAAALVVAWDMPFVSADLLAALRDRIGAGVDAVVPEGPHGLEPLCAAYAPSALAPLERALDRGTPRLGDVLCELRVDRVPADAVARFGPVARLFFNVNSAADLAAAERMARGG